MDRPPPNPLVHLELHTGNAAGASAFYARLLGWRPERLECPAGSYLSLDTGCAGVGGGIVETDRQRPAWLPYVEVPEVKDATELARHLGAAVLLEPREGPVGWRSVVASPSGGDIGLWQPKR